VGTPVRAVVDVTGFARSISLLSEERYTAVVVLHVDAIRDRETVSPP
jgi:hypothetical protein